MKRRFEQPILYNIIKNPTTMKINNDLFSDENFIRPLREAENEFLQVLLTDFNLKSKGKGLELTVKFDDDTPAIWQRKAKTHIFNKLSYEKRTFYQTQFKTLFHQDKINYDHSDATFPFRFGNGGTLPIVRMGEIDYYCFFYRDIHPIGWNIANGGANNVNDLLYPASIIERELREELIIIEPGRGRRYVFDWHDARLRDHPDFALADKLWMEQFRRRNFPEFSEIPLPLKWVPAPDMGVANDNLLNYDSLLVKYGNDPPIHTGYGLLNITGEDFGIEFDRIAKLSVGPDAIFCDGEIINRKLLNQVIGLFEVYKFNEAYNNGELEFKTPDLIYWNGENRTGESLGKVIEEYLDYRRINEKEIESSGIKKNDELTYSLCPVTHNLIHRFLQIEKQTKGPAKNESVDIFISFASQDKELAKAVYERLNGDYRVFFSDISVNHGTFAQQIDQALDTAWALVVVGSKLEYLNKTWVQYEWGSFHNDILDGRKPQDSPFIAFITGVDLYDLPRPFRTRTAIQGEPHNLSEAMRKLREFLRRP